MLNRHNIYIALFFPAASQGDCLELSQNHEAGPESRVGTPEDKSGISLQYREGAPYREAGQ